jgi:hypothetical protein
VFYEVLAMDVIQVTGSLEHYEWLIVRWAAFLMFVWFIILVVDKHIPVRAAIKRLIEWIFPSLKL